ncbi:hypothetical protein F5883DRAFT_562643 [Diaporthe sp. PMI_573]|nr:hypothetical protein F5883DRAFT_562643 [Diaporthaceae sp. PMI_573]
MLRQTYDAARHQPATATTYSRSAMSKRSASNGHSDVLSGDAKRVRLDEDADKAWVSLTSPNEPLLAVRRQSVTQAASAPADKKLQEITKQAGIQHSPYKARSREPSPSLWPSVHDGCQQAKPIEDTLGEWDRQMQDAYDRTDVHFRQARQEYIRFRENRLPSPTPSDEGSVVHDSDADEFGCVPLMFNLENDDPEVEQVFGAIYSHRLRERMRRRRCPTPPRVKPRYATIQAAKAAEARRMPPSHERDQASPPPSMRHSRALARSSGRRVSSAIVKPGREVPRRGQVLNNTERARGHASQDSALPFNRRLTRRSQQRQFYELDHRGKGRLVVRHQDLVPWQGLDITEHLREYGRTF